MKALTIESYEVSVSLNTETDIASRRFRDTIHMGIRPRLEIYKGMIELLQATPRESRVTRMLARSKSTFYPRLDQYSALMLLSIFEKPRYTPTGISIKKEEITIDQKGIKTESLASTLVNYLLNLKEVLSNVKQDVYKLPETYRESLLTTINKLDEVLESPQVPTPAKKGIIAIREHLKEALIKIFAAKEKEAEPYVTRALEIALPVAELLRLETEFGGVLALEDLLEVDKINGYPVYTIKRR